MKNKYNLTLEQNIFLAKKLYEDILYCGLKFEGLKISFSQMQTILYGFDVKDVSMKDRETILPIKNAWWYILNTIDKPLTLDYITKVNELLAERKDFVDRDLDNNKYNDCISSLIDKELILGEINNLLNTKYSNTKKALAYFMWGIKNRLFPSKNKITTLIITNKILISEGNGLLIIKNEDIEKLNKILQREYASKEYEEIVRLLYEKSIRGIDFQLKKLV